MSSQKPFQSKVFVPSARVFRTLYMDIPGFKSDHIAVYDTLFHYWNADYGYAWPSSCDIQLETGFGETHVRRLLGNLVEWGLVEVLANPNGDNKTYNLRQPIEDQQEFYRTFPEAVAAGEERRAKVRGRAARPKRAQRQPRPPIRKPRDIERSSSTNETAPEPTYGVPTREDIDRMLTAGAEEGPAVDLISYL